MAVTATARKKKRVGIIAHCHGRGGGRRLR
jgi:hypothetical protein